MTPSNSLQSVPLPPADPTRLTILHRHQPFSVSVASAVGATLSIRSAINVCAFRCSGGLRPLTSIGDRRYKPGGHRPPLSEGALELMSFCIDVLGRTRKKPVGFALNAYILSDTYPDTHPLWLLSCGEVGHHDQPGGVAPQAVPKFREVRKP